MWAAFQLQTLFKDMRHGSASGSLHCPISVTNSHAGLTLSQAYHRYLSDPSKNRSLKTLLTYRTASEVMVSFLGSDTPLASINRQQCRDLLVNLANLPSNAKKRWPRLSPKEALVRARELGFPGMSIANANALMNKFAALMNWAVNEELIPRNPAKALRLADPVLPRDKRLPFSLAQLQSIFSAPLFTGCQDDEAGYATPGRSYPRRARFWVPLIALFSGMRLNEICQMDAEDVVLKDGITCFSVTAQSGASDKRVKTASSERVVPVHGALIEIGFLDYVVAAQRQGGKLFPELLLRHGIYSHLFSRSFGRFLRKCGASSERTCFHSFRHNFRDAIRNARIEREVSLALGGWSVGNSVADRYGRGFEVGRLHEAIASIQYEGLDLSHLLLERLAAT